MESNILPMNHETCVGLMVGLDDRRGMTEGLSKGLEHLSELKKRSHRLGNDHRIQDHEDDDLNF